MVGMHKATISSAMFAATALLIAGCSGGQGTPGQPTEAPDSNALKTFDPCTALSADQIQSFGASPQGEPVDPDLGGPGCDYEGPEFQFGVMEGEGQGEQYWQGQQGQFDQFTPNQVGSLKGFTGIALSGKGQGVCAQTLYVGSGSVTVDVTYRSDNMPSDEETCAKATEIAQAVSAKLPK